MWYIHSDEFSFDYIGISEVFRCDRDQRISLPGYHDIITRCRESTDDLWGGGGGCYGGPQIPNPFKSQICSSILLNN